MEKQVIEVMNNGFYIFLKRGFLVLQNPDLNISQQIPLDNILSLVISADDIDLSKNVINALCATGGHIIFCGKTYLPESITIPYTGHWMIAPRVQQQIKCSEPLKKNLWKSIIQHKIENQAQILHYFYPQHSALERLKMLQNHTLSGDKSNTEGQAAALYFKALFGKHFVRDRLKDDYNILFNYTYTLVRAMIARSIAGSGILPYLGLKHCNKANPLPLVDDLIEPFRPIADKIIFQLLQQKNLLENCELTPQIKKQLATVIVYPVQTQKGVQPLHNAIHDFVDSLVQSFEQKKVQLQYPNILPKQSTRK